MLYEFCADGTEKIEAALRAGAGRVELCYGLQVGGLTPDEDSVVRAKEICDAAGVPLMCMIRPRSGPFEYSDAELEYIEYQARWAIDLGVSGLVLGMTRTEDAVPYMSRLDSRHPKEVQTFDAERMFGLLTSVDTYALGQGYGDIYPPLDITYHMAFDELSLDNQLRLLRMTSAFGITRVLTHGGSLETPIEQNFDRIKLFIDFVKEEQLDVKILPGGGITWQNANYVAEALGVDELHGSRIVKLDERSLPYFAQNVWLFSAAKFMTYEKNNAYVRTIEQQVIAGYVAEIRKCLGHFFAHKRKDLHAAQQARECSVHHDYVFLYGAVDGNL